MTSSVESRAAVHAALGEPVRLALAEDLALSDRTPSELSERFDLPTNLLAHHLDVLEAVGLIERSVSNGDRRRRYVRLRLESIPAGLKRPRTGRQAPLFVCTHNSARSQLASALWHRHTGRRARSAGTHPTDGVHPGAIAAARRAGLDLAEARPRLVTPRDLRTSLVVTVCDRAREELEPGGHWLHWSVPDPVESGTRRAFDSVLADLDERIAALAA